MAKPCQSTIVLVNFLQGGGPPVVFVGLNPPYELVGCVYYKAKWNWNYYTNWANESRSTSTIFGKVKSCYKSG